MKTSNLFSLNLEDLGKGLLVSVGGAVLAAVAAVLQHGSLAINWQSVGGVAAFACISYLLKNFFTPAQISLPVASIDNPPVSYTIAPVGQPITGVLSATVGDLLTPLISAPAIQAPAIQAPVIQPVAQVAQAAIPVAPVVNEGQTEQQISQPGNSAQAQGL